MGVSVYLVVVFGLFAEWLVIGYGGFGFDVTFVCGLKRWTPVVVVWVWGGNRWLLVGFGDWLFWFWYFRLYYCWVI